MTETSGLTDTDEMLELVFKETAPCEIPQHGVTKNKQLHEGDGEWYLTLRCPHCNAGTIVLVCPSFRNHVLSMMDTFECACGHCKHEIKLKDSLVSMIRRG